MSRYVASGILAILGWKNPSSDLVREDKAVVIFSHSSYWDFYLFLLYMIAYPDLVEDTWIVMKPQPFSMFGGYAGKILRSMGFLPATRVEDRNQGFVQRTVEFLQTQNKFRLMLSPKGTIVSAPWRSGYYWIAHTLQVPIQILGLDYQDRTFYLSHPISSDGAMEDIQPQLQQQMAEIVPLYLHQELHPDDVDQDDIGIVSRENLRTFVKVTLATIVGICFFI